MRLPSAHARISRLDSAAGANALGVLGVLGIFTIEHFKAVGDLPCGWQINNLDVTPMKQPKPPLDDSVIEHGDTSKALLGMGTRRDWSA